MNINQISQLELYEFYVQNNKDLETDYVKSEQDLSDQFDSELVMGIEESGIDINDHSQIKREFIKYRDMLQDYGLLSNVQANSYKYIGQY